MIRTTIIILLYCLLSPAVSSAQVDVAEHQKISDTEGSFSGQLDVDGGLGVSRTLMLLVNACRASK